MHECCHAHDQRIKASVWPEHSSTHHDGCREARVTKQVSNETWATDPPQQQFHQGRHDGYSWDPEATAFFQGLGLRAETRETYYTSIHYVVKPQERVDLTCEIQVRTLFEEVWGEIDHALNYPTPTTSLPCKEQLRVLAKLASTGTRLADAIFAIHEAHGQEIPQAAAAPQ